MSEELDPKDQPPVCNAEAAASNEDASLDFQWLEDAVGPTLLAYLLGCEVEALAAYAAEENELNQNQQAVLNEFAQLRSELPEGLTVKDVASTVLTQFGQSGVTNARAIRLRVVGSEHIPPGHDDVERAFVSLALDAYPALLLPPEPDPFPYMMRDQLSRWVMSLLFQHPQASEFSEAVLHDAVMKKIFVFANESAGYVGTVYRNTGSGGGLQLSMLSGMMLQRVWARIRSQETSPEMFAKEALKELRLVRDILAGKSRTATAKVGFAGVLLPAGAEFTAGNVRVRAMSEEDRNFAPPSLKGQLSGTDAAGATTTINYDGDVLMEVSFPYKIRIIPQGTDLGPTQWPEDLVQPAEIDQAAVRLRFSLMLAVERGEQRAQLVQTWRAFDEPLQQGYASAWNDPRQGTGIMPMQLTEDEVSAWREWYERLCNPAVDRIELALTRILRAIAERRDVSDLLVDSVIAWENLFGTKEGEPTFRITACLAKLLASSGQERVALRSTLGKIYGLRSDVVHGNANLKQKDYPRCQEALDVAIRAVKALVVERPDILELKDGALRSASLLLGDEH